MPADTPSLAWVTCTRLPEPDADERPALDALRAAGIAAHPAAWDDPAVDWSRFGLAVLRSPWNYYHDPAAFDAWLGRVDAATTLLNPLAACRWNLHKGYLRELERAGVAIVPTEWQDAGEPPQDIAAIMDARGWDRVVVKPAISAGSFGTRRFARDEAAEAGAFLAELASRGDAMIQQYIAGVDDAGEHALVWIEGRLTHAVRKSPRLAGDDESVSGELAPTPEQAEFAERVLGALPPEVGDGLLYARIDVMPTPAGWVLSELELLEPSLFMVQSPAARSRFVDAIAQRLRIAPGNPSRSASETRRG